MCVNLIYLWRVPLTGTDVHLQKYYIEQQAMENKRAWLAPSQYFTNRWLKQHQASSHLMTADSYSPGDHRYSKNNRKFSAGVLSQSSSFTKYHIQELCLDNNKLFIIDSQRQLNGLNKQSKNGHSFKAYRKICNQEYLSSFGFKTAKSQFVAPKHNLRKASNNQKENTSGQEKVCCNLSAIGTANAENRERNIMKKLAFNKKKRNQKPLTFEVQQTQYQSPIKVTINIQKAQTPSKLKPNQQSKSISPQKSKRSLKLSDSEKSKRSKKDQRLLNSPIKSLKAPISRQKSQRSQKSLKSVRSQQSIKSRKKSPQKVEMTVEIIQEKEGESKANSILPELAEQASQQIEINREYLIAQLLDPVELLNFVQPMYRLMPDPYQDFPEWRSYLLLNPPILIQTQLDQNEIPTAQIQQHLQGQQVQANALQRKLTLPIEEMQENNRLITDQNKEKIQEQSIPTLIQDNTNSYSKRCISMIVSVDHQLLIHPENKPRRLTTKTTDKPLDSSTNQEAILPIFQAKVQSSILKNTEIIRTKQVKNIYDNDFNLKQQFPPQEKITFIDIKPTNQTAYFPSSLKNPIYIHANPSNSSIYRNIGMINLINLFLRVKPSKLQEVFLKMDGPLYRCCLYENGLRKVMGVDGLFPFDENYYPLFGSVEQYIWFGVLVKAIAKLKGSYKKLSGLDFQQLFPILTNNKLYQVSSYLLFSSNPSNDILTLQKQAQKSELFILITQNDKLYKLDKISYLKSISQQKEELQQQLMIKNIKLLGSSKKESNMNSLNNYLKQEKKQLTIQRIFENTKVRLLGVEQKKSVSLMELLSSNYQIWMPQPFDCQAQNAALVKIQHGQ